MKAEPITAPDAAHGEGPVWWPGWGGLRWVDMLAGDVLHLDPVTGAVDRWHVGSVAAALRPRAVGGAVIATEHDFTIVDRPGAVPTVIATPFIDAGIRFNDGDCDPYGRFLCGTMDYAEAPERGKLFVLDRDGSVRVALGDVTISNGLAWTADGALAFYVDTPTGRVDVFDSDRDGLHDRRQFVTIDTSAGQPDGLTIDAEGGVWVALWGGAAVHRYGPTGTLDAVVELSVGKVTACTFGGENLDELFITTSRHGDDEPHPLAGALFHARPGVAGQPTRTFAG